MSSDENGFNAKNVWNNRFNFCIDCVSINFSGTYFLWTRRQHWSSDCDTRKLLLGFLWQHDKGIPVHCERNNWQEQASEVWPSQNVKNMCWTNRGWLFCPCSLVSEPLRWRRSEMRDLNSNIEVHSRAGAKSCRQLPQSGQKVKLFTTFVLFVLWHFVPKLEISWLWQKLSSQRTGKHDYSAFPPTHQIPPWGQRRFRHMKEAIMMR